MGCGESKSSVATGNTITQSKNPSSAGAAPIDEPEKVVVPLADKASEEAADVKEVTRDAGVASEVEKKDDAVKDDEKEKPGKDEDVKEEKAVGEKEPEKENGSKDVAHNEEGSIKGAEPTHETTSSTVAETPGAVVSEESNPPEKE